MYKEKFKENWYYVTIEGSWTLWNLHPDLEPYRAELDEFLRERKSHQSVWSTYCLQIYLSTDFIKISLMESVGTQSARYLDDRKGM